MDTLNPIVAPASAAAYPVGLIDRLNLPGQRAVVIRPILPQDADAEQAFVSGLSLASRHKRFHVGLQRLSPSLLKQMTEIDYRRHVALVAQAMADSRSLDAVPEIVADARYVHLAATSEAEFAIAVADEWQSLGLGRALMARMARHAKAQGLSALVGDVLPENRRMLVLMRGLGAHTRPHPDGPQLVQVVYPLA